jgi:hypothetical protein
MAAAMIFIIGTLLGVIAGARVGSGLERLISGSALLAWSVPMVVSATVLVGLFGAGRSIDNNVNSYEGGAILEASAFWTVEARQVPGRRLGGWRAQQRVRWHVSRLFSSAAGEPGGDDRLPVRTVPSSSHRPLSGQGHGGQIAQPGSKAPACPIIGAGRL